MFHPHMLIRRCLLIIVEGGERKQNNMMVHANIPDKHNEQRYPMDNDNTHERGGGVVEVMGR
jgi:hypothetical protein